MSRESSGTVNLSRRVRPLRLAFLVEPRSASQVRRAIEINTILWGGIFNPLVPVHRKRPPSLDGARSTGIEVTQGYLRAFEPDYLVEMKAGLAQDLVFDKNRLLSTSDVLEPNAIDPIHHGLCAADIYAHHFKKRFQFVQRTPITVAHPTITLPGHRLLSDAWFGRFPTDGKLQAIQREFSECFDAKSLPIKSTGELFTPALQGIESPLAVGATLLEVYLDRNYAGRQILFLLDPASVLDVIDFWNLRALGKATYPLPVGAVSQLARSCAQLTQPLEDEDPLMPEIANDTVLIKGRSLRDTQLGYAAQQLAAQKVEHLTLQRWYPRLWDDWGRKYDGAVRCDVVASETEERATVANGRFSFSDLAPAVASRRARMGAVARWANTVKLRTYDLDECTTLLPSVDLSARLYDPYGDGAKIWCSSEGVTTAVSRTGWQRNWRIPRTQEVFAAWAKKKELSVEVSSAGRIASEMLRAVGGASGAGCLAHVELIALLNDLAHGMFETEVSATPSASKGRTSRPKTRAGTISRARLFDLLRKVQKIPKDGRTADAHKSLTDKRAEMHLETLVARNVVRVGLKLQCNHCQQRNWYALAELRDEVRCERCLQLFPFPAASPGLQTEWAYRPIGTFAIEGFAQGSYSVALTISALSRIDRAEISWIPGFDIKGDGLDCEFDFGALLPRNSLRQGAASVVVGECKDGDRRFGQKDFKHASTLLQCFPGLGFVFATTRSELDQSEREAISRIAMRGRKTLTGEDWTNPVIVLTRHELEWSFGAPAWWRSMPSFTKALENTYWSGSDSLRSIANITQQLHLGMESFESTQVKLLEKIRARLTKVSAVASAPH